jgi:hypothetical protein
MGISRQAGIPINHVMAELAAFPLVSEEALAIGPGSLDPGMGGATGRLWRQTEKTLVESFPSFSIDEIVALRDRIWFAEGARHLVPLDRYLRRLARWFLETNGPVAVPRLPPEECLPGAMHLAHTPIARRAWLWLTFALPPDLLLGGLDRNGHGPEKVELLSPWLVRHLLENGYAETHLHVGAALDFPLLWNTALHALADPAFRADAFQSPGAGCCEGIDLAPWLLRAALGRYVLSAYLVQQPRPSNFFNYLRTILCVEVTPHIGAAGFSRLIDALGELEQGRLGINGDSDFHQLKGVYAQLTGLRVVTFPSRLVEAMQADPLDPLLPAAGSRRTPEVRFVARALEFLERNRAARREDALFEILFWQIVRVRSLFYRHIVQRPLTPGLEWFVRFYGRGRPTRYCLASRTLVESAARLGGAGAGLRSLEIRTSPYASISANLAYVDTIDKIAREWGGQRRGRSADAPLKLELGLVFHFIKRREGGADSGEPRAHWRGSNADPTLMGPRSGNPTGYRYAHYYRQRRVEAQSLAWLLCHRPLSLQLVRGVDVCTDELGVPNWVMAPLLERVRRAASQGALALQRVYGWSPPPLRTTVHAGEDFVHLLTGLRHVDEAIEQLSLREGDRIGHGLALGVEPRDWSSRAGRTAMVLEERLLDLVWEWDWHGEQGSSPGEDRSIFLEREIACLSNVVFGKPVLPYELSLLRRDLCDSQRLYQAGFPDGPPPSLRRCPRRLRRLCRYLTEASVFERGRQVIWVDPVGEGEILVRLQAALRRKIGARGLAVEVNPTSNLLIGDLGDLTAHPLWRLHPPRGTGDAPPVTICVGSDDPLVFASNLRQEYQFLGDALVLAGLSEEEARQWLDRTRARSLESRFTRPRHLPEEILSLFSIDDPEPMLL